MSYESLMARMVQDHPDDAVIVVDSDETIVEWSEGAQRIYGWKRGEVIGHSVGEITPPLQYLDPNESYETTLAALFSAGSWRGTVIQPHRDGHLLTIDSSVRLFRDPDGMMCGAVGINRDITAQTRRTALLRFEAAVPTNEREPTLIWQMTANHDFELVAANRAALDYLGNPTGDLRAQRASVVYLDQAEILLNMVRAVAQEHPIDDELRVPHPSGRHDAMLARFTFHPPDYVICHLMPRARSRSDDAPDDPLASPP